MQYELRVGGVVVREGEGRCDAEPNEGGNLNSGVKEDVRTVLYRGTIGEVIAWGAERRGLGAYYTVSGAGLRAVEYSRCRGRARERNGRPREHTTYGTCKYVLQSAS